MLPKYHFIFGLSFVIFLYFLFPQISLLGLSIIFLSSFFIDVDHYLYYFLKEKNLNLKRGYNWYKNKIKRTYSLPMSERKKIYSGFYLFHGIEWIILLFLLGYFISSFFTFIAIGFLFHLIVDVFHEIYFKRSIDKSSLIYNYYRWRKLKIKN